jgi:hypothetical protein
MVAPGRTFAPDPSDVTAYRRVLGSHSRLAGLADQLFTDG